MTENTIAEASRRMAVDVADLAGSNTDLAVIVTEPGANAVTRPVEFTDASAGSLLVHVISSEAPPTTFATAFSCAKVPTINAAGAADMVTERTAGA